jgi:omega-6 fatty acid desaturase (delta-12 desaturase)
MACLAGIMIGVLFVVGHDAAHNSLTPSTRLNRWIGVMAFLPSLHSFSLWELGHNRTHHRWTNFAPKDYVWTPLDWRQYSRLSRFRQLQYQFYRSAWGPLLYYAVEIWLRHTLFPFRRDVPRLNLRYAADTAAVVVFAAAYLTLLIVGLRVGWWGDPGRAWWNPALFGAGIPFLVWNSLMGFVIYLHHTHPDVAWYDDEEGWRIQANQAELAVHVLFPTLINQLFHWILEHNAHHARTGIPFYDLRRSQELLQADGSAQVTEFVWTPGTHMAVVRRCKLFDFRAGRWMDFQGNYTSGGRQAAD